MKPASTLPRGALLRQWLRAGGSLSRRLAALGQRFEVQMLREGAARLHTRERFELGARASGRVFVREVLLRVDGEPLVWARSIVPALALCGPWRALRGLGARPLAELLFDDPRITRTPLRAERVPHATTLGRRIERQWRDAEGRAAPRGMVWARASVFRRAGVPLRVMEVFAPRLGTCRPPRTRSLAQR